jgi:hypothetical protein
MRNPASRRKERKIRIYWAIRDRRLALADVSDTMKKLIIKLKINKIAKEIENENKIILE